MILKRIFLAFLISTMVLSSPIVAQTQEFTETVQPESEEEKTVFEQNQKMGTLSPSVDLVDIQQRNGYTYLYMTADQPENMIWFTPDHYNEKSITLDSGNNIVKVPYAPSKIGVGVSGDISKYTIGGTELLPDIDPRYSWGSGVTAVFIGLLAKARYKIRGEKKRVSRMG